MAAYMTCPKLGHSLSAQNLYKAESTAAGIKLPSVPDEPQQYCGCVHAFLTGYAVSCSVRYGKGGLPYSPQLG